MAKRLAVMRAHVRQRAARMLVALARPAGLFVAALPTLIGLVLLSVGAGMVYRPAGFITAGVLILADKVADRVADGRGAKASGG